MAIRQYIGARYVTKIYKNSQDPSSTAWEAGVTYEPLTMVSYQNNSYMSRDTVGPTVGNPAENPDHWAITGFYNGQIAELQDDIDTINDNISSLGDDIESCQADVDLQKVNNKKFWYIGDSFLSMTEGWGHWIDAYLSKTDSLVTAEGGIGFAKTGGTSGKTMTQLINSAAPDDDVTDVVIILGCNDCQAAYASDLGDAVASVLGAVRAKLPTARIWVGFNATFQGTNNYDTYNVRYPYIDTAYNTIMLRVIQAKYAAFMKSVYYQLQYNPQITDGVHPAGLASRILARNILNHIFGGGDAYYVQRTKIGNVNFVCSQDIINIYVNEGAAVFANTTTPINLTAGDEITVMSDQSWPVVPRHANQFKMSCLMQLAQSSTNYTYDIGSVRIQADGTLTVRTASAHSNVATIRLYGFNLSTPYMTAISPS